MLSIGVGVGIAGIFAESIFFQDYWRPPLLFSLGHFGGIEDFLFGFALGGVGTALYGVVFHKRFRKKGNPHLWIIPLLILSELVCIWIFFYGFKINSIYASAIGFIIPSFIIMIVRKDLIVETIFSAILVGSLMVFLEMLVLLFAPTYLANFYLLYGKAPLLFSIVPITEFLWGTSFASVAGPLFDFEYGDVPIAFVKKKQKRIRDKKYTELP
ncbi:MAG TPA: hypothetical protein VGT05_05325 [Patescibacteria group bacterium]|nr:hypothetical protein [Patescibacteria group bacterium]